MHGCFLWIVWILSSKLCWSFIWSFAHVNQSLTSHPCGSLRQGVGAAISCSDWQTRIASRPFIVKSTAMLCTSCNRSQACFHAYQCVMMYLNYFKGQSRNFSRFCKALNSWNVSYYWEPETVAETLQLDFRFVSASCQTWVLHDSEAMN